MKKFGCKRLLFKIDNPVIFAPKPREICCGALKPLLKDITEHLIDVY